MADIQNNEPVAYFYELTGVGKELVLDCNGEYARKLLEAGYTETPLFTRAAPPAMDREAVYRQALEDVCNPLGYLQRMADAEGAKLSGMAYAIASDIGTIQRIAKEALSTLSADAIRQGEGWQPISDADTSQERLTVLGYGTFRGRSHPQVVVLDWVKWIGSWSAYTMPFEPTHWMPLPATPASHASDGGKA